MPNKVYVINKHGRPLMPCSPAKARHLLDDGKAKVKERTPFTIQLVYGSSGYTQEVILGVDAGSKTIGMSASTTKEELLSAEVKPRNDVVDLLSTRREFRRVRRNYCMMFNLRCYNMIPFIFVSLCCCFQRPVICFGTACSKINVICTCT